MSETFTIKIDNREIECQPGDKVLAKALEHGIYIPHYCYHPGLTIAGNCRMCLVKSNKAPKPVISCAADCVPGLEIDASSAEVAKLQAAIMEFLLINHPLDCPVCDQAGECRLQDYAHEYGRAEGRFREAKNVKPNTVVGPEVALWKQRCIACSRCIRFCDEISGTGELRFLQRGDRVEIETFPGVPLDNPLSGNVVDICPVGALVSTDFLFEARVWNLTRQPSVCPGCARGCNVHVDVLATKWDEPVVKRLVPRENLEVNRYWMCDFGRHEIDDLHELEVAGEKRARLSAVQAGARHVSIAPEAAAAAAANGASGNGASGNGASGNGAALAHGIDGITSEFARAIATHRGKIVIVGNLWQTVEEMHLVSALAKELGAEVGLLARPLGDGYVFPGFEISADKNPNRAGAIAVFGEQVVSDGLAKVERELADGKATMALVFGGVTRLGDVSGLCAALGRAAEVFVVATFEDEIASQATWLIPGVTWAEKDGTWINEDGRLQRVARSFESPGEATGDLEILQSMLRAVGGFAHEGVSAAGIFQLAGAAVSALSNVKYPARGSHGVSVSEAIAGGKR